MYEFTNANTHIKNELLILSFVNFTKKRYNMGK